MFRSVCRALVAFGVLGFAATAQAGSLSYTGYAVYGNQNVFLDLTLPDRHVSEWAGSGEIILYTDQVTGGALGTWCVDIPDTLRGAGTFAAGQVLTGSFGNTVNALLSNVLPLLGGDAYAPSALQVAIWTAEYGNALTVVAPSEVYTLVSTYLQNVANGTYLPDPHSDVALLAANGTNQDQVYLTAVPEPGSLVLAVGGLVGLLGVGLARRRVSRTS